VNVIVPEVIPTAASHDIHSAPYHNTGVVTPEREGGREEGGRRERREGGGREGRERGLSIQFSAQVYLYYSSPGITHTERKREYMDYT